MSLLCGMDKARAMVMAEVFAREAPDIEFRILPDVGDPAKVEYLVAWQPRAELVRTLPNLKVMFVSGAGVDHVDFGVLPPGVPVVRMVEPGIVQGMVEYVSWAVISLHRNMADYAAQQSQEQWRMLPFVPADARTVGVLGLGVLGQAVLRQLAGFGFRLRGWSRSGATLGGVECFAGADALPAFLGGCHVLVCLLPLTDGTRGCLDARLYAQLPRGAALVNVGRGGHLVEADLLAALDAGQLSRAVLDVCEPEPLPAGHRFWRHPRITLTPHIASVTQPASAARVMLANIRRHQQGEPLQDVVDPARGY